MTMIFFDKEMEIYACQQPFSNEFIVEIKEIIRGQREGYWDKEYKYPAIRAEVEIVSSENNDSGAVNKMTILKVERNSHKRESTYDEKQILEAIRFKEYFDKLYEKNLDTSLEPFNKLYEKAIDYARVKKC